MAAETALESSPTVSLGIYRRVVRASLTRVWENVLDWEHLPWLHKESFRSISKVKAGPDGWRAHVEFTAGGDADIDVAVDWKSESYLTTTASGTGIESEIETRLTPRGDFATGIEVSFRMPGVSEESRKPVFEIFRTLYTQLWDQDEEMMRRRQHVLDDGRVPATWREVEVDGRRCRFVARCPHLGGPLMDAAVEDGEVTCPWHGYRFDVRTGACVSGQRLRLKVAPA